MKCAQANPDLGADDVFQVNRPRRNSNPGIIAGRLIFLTLLYIDNLKIISIYVTRPWRRRTSTTEDEIKQSKTEVMTDITRRIFEK